MNDDSRSLYLKALLNQKKQIKNNTMSLLNPSVTPSSDIGQLAALDTSINNIDSMPEEPSKPDRNGYQRTIDTIGEFTMDLQSGIIGFIGGIGDAAIYAAGGVGKLFGADDQWARDAMAYDWESQSLAFSRQMDTTRILAGDVFTKDYWDKWGSIGSVEKSRELINETHQNSFTSQMGEHGQDIYNEIVTGVGNALPSVALAIATGGNSLGAEAAIYGALGASAFGNAASSALQDGASYGQAGLYGAASAGIEILTEKISGGINGVKVGSKAIKKASETGFKAIAKSTIKNMVGEGMEEVVSDILDPIAKAVTYKGKEALNEYKDPEFYEGLLVSFTAGALGAFAGGEIQKTNLRVKYSKPGVEVLEEFNKAQELQAEFNERVAKGEDVNTLAIEYGTKYSECIKNGFQLLAQLKETNNDAFNTLVKDMTNTKGSDITIDDAYKGLQTNLNQDIVQRYANEISSKLGTEINIINDEAFKDADSFQKATGVTLDTQTIQRFNNPETIKNGLTINNKVYISSQYQNDINKLIVHEGIAHGFIDTNAEVRDSLLLSLRGNKEFREKINKISEEVYNTYGLKKSTVTDLLNPTSNVRETLNSETMAKFVEFLYSDNNIKPLLNATNKTKLTSLLSRSISYLKAKGNNTLKARLQIEKIINKIKNIKDNTTNANNLQTARLSVEKPKEAKSNTYSDFFNTDGTINADWVKRGARANYGTIINLSDSKTLIKLAVSNIVNIAPNDIRIGKINVIAREFFESFNVSDGIALRTKAINKLTNDILNSTIKLETGEIVKIEKYAKQLAGGVNGFKIDIANSINTMIDKFGEKSKILKAYEKFRSRINQIQKIANEEVESSHLVIKNIQLKEKIKSKFENHSIKNRVGVLFPEVPFIRDLIKGINPSKSNLSISPNSIVNIVNNFEKINYKKGSETLDALNLEFNENWYNTYEYFKNKLKINNAGEKYFPNRALTLEENVMLNSFMKDLNSTLTKLVSNRELEIRESFSKATTNIKVVSETVNPNKKTSFIAKQIDITSSPDVRLRRIYGQNSEVVKICYDNLLSAYVSQQGKAQQFINTYEELAKKYKVNKKLESKTKITLNGVEYNITNGLLLDIYIHSLVDENRAVLKKDGYVFTYNGRNTKPILFTDEMLLEVENRLSPQLKEFGNEVLDYFNNELKTYAKNSGIDVSPNLYYPLSRSDVTQTQADTIIQKFRGLNPDALPINQQRKNNVHKSIKGLDITSRVKSYADQVSRIGEMSEALETYSKFLNTKVIDDNGNKVSRNELMKRVDSEWSTWKAYTENQILGIPIENKIADSKLMRSLVSSTLFGNISTVLKQTGSIPTILAEVHFSSFVKGLAGIKNVKNAKNIKLQLMQESPLLNKRFSTGEVIQAQTLSNQISNIAKIFGLPMQKVDEGIILTFCYQSAQYEAELEGAGKVGTDSNHKRAIQILERIVLNTQSNAVAPKMSMARSGYGGFVRKALSYFTSDLNNTINLISNTITSKRTAERNIAQIEIEIKKVDAKLKDNTTNQEEINKLNQEKTNLNNLLEENKVYSSGSDKFKEVIKLLFILASKGLLISGIAQLVDRIYGRKGWNENTSEEFAKDLLFESTIYNLPYVQTIANSIEYNQQVGGFDFTVINSAIDIFTTCKKQIESGDANWNKTLFNMADLLGKVTGFPIKNLYNLAMGIGKQFSKEAYGLDAYLKGYSNNYISSQYKEATETGRDKQAEGYLELMMKTNKVTTTNQKIYNELYTLSKEGYNALPKNYMLGYRTDEGEIKLTSNEVYIFRNAYDTSTTSVNELLEVNGYNSLTSEEKSILIKKIYDTYYDYAKVKTINSTPSSRLVKLLAYSNNQFTIGKYVKLLNDISKIKENKNKTRKELVIAYVNRLNLTIKEKLLLLHLAGYGVNEENKKVLVSLLRQKGFTSDNIEDFLG